MNLNLDNIDRRLLSLLQANAREPAATLARKLKLARTTVVAMKRVLNSPLQGPLECRGS